MCCRRDNCSVVYMTETLTELAGWRARLRTELADVSERLRVAALEKLAAGSNESEVAREAGVDRMTVRKWRGKR